MTALELATRRTFRSLKVRNYRLYFIGQIISFSGTWMQSIAQMWLVYELTSSGTALGITTALQFLPMMVAGLWGGVIADRFDKRRLLIWTQTAQAVLAVILGTLVLFEVVQLWMVYSLAFALGCVIVIDNPTRQSFAAEMVGPEDLSNAIGLNSAIFTSARVMGPALGGVVIALFGVGACFLINAFSYVAVILALRAMNPEALYRKPPAERSPGQLREGLRYAWSDPVLRSGLLLMAVVGTLAFNFRVLLPVMAEQEFAGGAETYGLLSAVMGGGTLIGALTAASRKYPTLKMLYGSAFAYGLLIVVAGLAPTLPLELVVLVPMGAAGLAFVSTANATLQMNSDDSMRGRVMALYAVVFLGSTPIGSPIVGWVAEELGVRAAFHLGGVATAIAAVVTVWWLRRARRADATSLDTRAEQAAA